MFQHFQMSESNIIMLYLLGILLAAMTVSRRGAVVISSLLSVLLFNFFFVEPLYSFQMDGKEYPVTIGFPYYFLSYEPCPQPFQRNGKKGIPDGDPFR